MGICRTLSRVGSRLQGGGCARGCAVSLGWSVCSRVLCGINYQNPCCTNCPLNIVADLKGQPRLVLGQWDGRSDRRSKHLTCEAQLGGDRVQALGNRNRNTLSTTCTYTFTYAESFYHNITSHSASRCHDSIHRKLGSISSLLSVRRLKLLWRSVDPITTCDECTYDLTSLFF